MRSGCSAGSASGLVCWSGRRMSRIGSDWCRLRGGAAQTRGRGQATCSRCRRWGGSDAPEQAGAEGSSGQQARSPSESCFLGAGWSVICAWTYASNDPLPAPAAFHPDHTVGVAARAAPAALAFCQRLRPATHSMRGNVQGQAGVQKGKSGANLSRGGWVPHSVGATQGRQVPRQCVVLPPLLSLRNVRIDQPCLSKQRLQQAVNISHHGRTGTSMAGDVGLRRHPAAPGAPHGAEGAAEGAGPSRTAAGAQAARGGNRRVNARAAGKAARGCVAVGPGQFLSVVQPSQGGAGAWRSGRGGNS